MDFIKSLIAMDITTLANYNLFFFTNVIALIIAGLLFLIGLRNPKKAPAANFSAIVLSSVAIVSMVID